VLLSQTPQLDAGGARGTIKLGLYIEYQASALAQQSLDERPAAFCVSIVRNGQNDGIGRPQGV
jgi:hypothetical protein